MQAQVGKLRQGLARLIDSYAEGLIEKGEFEPRVGRLRQRIRALEEHVQCYADEAVVRSELQLIVGRLDEFAARVRDGLTDADWYLRREIIRLLVTRIDVTPSSVDVVFRINPTLLGPHAPSDTLQDCWPRLDIAPPEGSTGNVGGVLGDRIDGLWVQ